VFDLSDPPTPSAPFPVGSPSDFQVNVSSPSPAPSPAPFHVPLIRGLPYLSEDEFEDIEDDGDDEFDRMNDYPSEPPTPKPLDSGPFFFF
jgi:hypothetical protein